MENTKNYWVIGQGGIGTAVATYLQQQGATVTIISRNPQKNNDALYYLQCDASDEQQVQALIADNKMQLPQGIIIATGILHDKNHMPEKSVQQLELDWFNINLQANLYPTLFFSKYLTAVLKRAAAIKVLALSARVASITDNRLGGWYSYRMSKAALNMLVKNVALEWKLKAPDSIIVGYHPGTVNTALSMPFQKNIAAEQLFEPKAAAKYCTELFHSLSPEMSGFVYDWQKKQLEF